MENQFYEMKIGIIECKNLYVERVRVKDFLNSKFFRKIHFKKSNVHNLYYNFAQQELHILKKNWLFPVNFISHD